MTEQENSEPRFITFLSRIRKKTKTPDPPETIKPFVGRFLIQELRGDLLCEHLEQAILEAHGFVFDPSVNPKAMLCEKKFDGKTDTWPQLKGAKYSFKPKDTLEKWIGQSRDVLNGKHVVHVEVSDATKLVRAENQYFGESDKMRERQDGVA